MFEFWSFTEKAANPHLRRVREFGCVRFKAKSEFYGISDTDVIKLKHDGKPYYIDMTNHCSIIDRVKEEYKIPFGRSSRPCHLLKQEKYAQCPYLSHAQKIPPEKVLWHLLRYDHYEAFNKPHPHCREGKHCDSFQKILNNMNPSIFDKIHLAKLYHPTKTMSNYNEINYKNINARKNEAPFEYIDMRQQRAKATAINFLLNVVIKSTCALTDEQKVFLIINEAVKNGYEKDMLPNFKSDNFSFEQFISENNLSNIINRDPYNEKTWKATTCTTNPAEYNNILQKLAKHYRIIDVLTTKMQHPTHVRMQQPLSKANMISLMLYCDGKCNYDLSRCQRDGSYFHKWPYLNAFLNHAIFQANKHEKHREKIYSGYCGVKLAANSIGCDKILCLVTNTSFSSDLNVAKQFCGADGMILGINMDLSFSYKMGAFVACDVSWISQSPSEKEILCAKGSQLIVSKSKITARDGKQWIVCSEGSKLQTSFQSIFLSKVQ